MPLNFTRQDLQDTFEAFGNIESLNLAGRGSQGEYNTGYVTMRTDDQALDAYKGLTDKLNEKDGHRYILQIRQAKAPRPPHPLQPSRLRMPCALMNDEGPQLTAMASSQVHQLPSRRKGYCAQTSRLS